MRVPGGVCVCVCVWLDVCDVAVCNPDGISEPASLGMIEDYNQMLIGQDSTSTPPASPQIGSDTDVNDVVWVFDFTTMALTRIISAPWGAATASPAWHKAIKAANLPDAHPGFHYLTTSLAHPYGENGNHPKLAAAASTGAQGYVAYLGPFPTFYTATSEDTNATAGGDTHIVRASIAVEIPCVPSSSCLFKCRVSLMVPTS